MQEPSKEIDAHHEDSDDWPQAVKDHYKILSKLGQGAYGKVFKVKHRESGVLYAMKHIQNIFVT